MTPSPEQDGIRKEFEAWAQDVRGESDVSELEPAGWTVWQAAYAAGMRAQRQKDAKIAFEADTNWDAKEKILADESTAH